MPPSLLPPEILVSIISLIQLSGCDNSFSSLTSDRRDLTTLVNLSLSSRLLSRLTRPILFHTLDFVVMGYDHSLPRLLRLFVHSPALASHVRRLRIPSKYPPTTANHSPGLGVGWDYDDGNQDTHALLARLRALGIAPGFADLVEASILRDGAPLLGPPVVEDDVVVSVLLSLCQRVEFVHLYYPSRVMLSPGISPLVFRVLRKAISSSGGIPTVCDYRSMDTMTAVSASSDSRMAGELESVPCARLKVLWVNAQSIVSIANVWEFLRLPALKVLCFVDMGGYELYRRKRWHPPQHLVQNSMVRSLQMARCQATPEFFEQIFELCPGLRQLKLGIEASYDENVERRYLERLGDALRRTARDLEVLMIELEHWDSENLAHARILGPLKELTHLRMLEVSIDTLWEPKKGSLLSLVELLPTSLEELCILYAVRPIALDVLDEALWELMNSWQFQKLACVWIDRSTPFSFDLGGSQWQSTLGREDGLAMWRGEKIAQSITKQATY